MFRTRLKSLREAIGYSQAKLAAALNVRQSTVGGWESGKREPNFDTVTRMADFFSVSVDYLLGRTDVPLYPWEFDAGGQRIRTFGPKKEALPEEELQAIEEAIRSAVPVSHNAAVSGDIRSYIRQMIREELGKSGDSGSSQ